MFGTHVIQSVILPLNMPTVKQSNTVLILWPSTTWPAVSVGFVRPSLCLSVCLSRDMNSGLIDNPRTGYPTDFFVPMSVWALFRYSG